MTSSHKCQCQFAPLQLLDHRRFSERLRRILSFIALAALLLSPGCGTPNKQAANTARLYPADIDRLAGVPWVGSLTYLDYKSHKHTTIDSSIEVRRTGNHPAQWEFGYGYAKEPHADSKETVTLSADGRTFDGEAVISRTALPNGGLLFITEADGEDDNRPARFRFEYSITAHECSRRKLVRFNDGSGFFERHVYRWKRP